MAVEGLKGGPRDASWASLGGLAEGNMEQNLKGGSFEAATLAPPSWMVISLEPEAK
uniref:Bm11909 n=1 Tax=Brugia malayi TaxID=6279 RepID=A0A1I9G7W0_BRUMA|nr:Bm11909 [Brugia malayi]